MLINFELHCVKKNIRDIFNCNLKKKYLILINFRMNIPNTTCHQKNIQFPTSPSVELVKKDSKFI